MIWSAYSTFELFLTCNAKSDLRAEEKHRYLHFNYVFYASVIQMSVTDANALELNYKKTKYSKVFAEKLPCLKKIKKRKPLFLWAWEPLLYGCLLWQQIHITLCFQTWHLLPAGARCQSKWTKSTLKLSWTLYIWLLRMFGKVRNFTSSTLEGLMQFTN